MKRSVVAAAVVVAVLLGLGFARDAFAQKRGIDVQLYKPAPLQSDLLTLETSRLPEPMAFTLSSHINFARDPLLIFQGGNAIESAVSHLVTLNVSYAIAPLSFLLVSVDLPVHLYMAGGGGAAFGTGASDLDRSAVSDMRVNLKWRILGEGRRGFGLALATPFSIPLGDGDRFRGEANWTFSPRVMIDYAWDRVAVAWTGGLLVREEVVFGNLHFNDELFFGLGVKVVLAEQEAARGGKEAFVTAMAELLTRTSAVTPFDKLNENPVEMLLGARLRVPKSGWDLTAGIGFGLQAGYGSPAFRPFIGAQWTLPPPPAPPAPPPCPECEKSLPPPPCPACKAPPPPPPPCPEAPKCPECPKVEPPPKKTEPVAAVKKPAVFDLKRLHFDTARWVPRRASLPELDALVKLMKAIPTLVIRIEGHTDPRGGHYFNVGLSQKRANTVRAHLIKNGIDAKRVTAAGMAETRPRASNDTEEGRLTNRRVEVHLVSGVPDDIEVRLKELKLF